MSTPTIPEIYISVDVETAGPIPVTYSLLSIGASVVGSLDQDFYAELQPLSENAVPEALKISGFSLPELAKTGEEPGAAMHRFRTWIREVSGDGRPVFVAFNAGFDWSFLNWYFHTYEGTNPFGFAPLDIKAYYMGFAGCTWAQTSSSKLPPHFQATETIANHNALTDAKAQAEIFAKLLQARSSDE